jgi:uncharacterized protein YbbC (DUF1343 family)
MWGIDRLSAGELGNTRRRLRNSTVALLSQASAVDRHGRPVLDVLEELGVRPLRIFAGEHGFDGVAQAEEAVPTRARDLTQASPLATDATRVLGDAAGIAALDTASGPPPTAPDEEAAAPTPRAPSLPPPIISLYGSDRASLSPQPEHLAGVDVLLIDLMDVGSRYYTFVWTALLAARAAARAGVHTLVLDRPNPISGDPGSVEGAPQAPGYTSFVGLESIPIRHAMTVAECSSISWRSRATPSDRMAPSPSWHRAAGSACAPHEPGHVPSWRPRRTCRASRRRSSIRAAV